MYVRRGSPYPLGATWDGRSGVNFALYSESATGVELCLQGPRGTETRVPMRDRTAFVWHCFVDGVGPGQRARDFEAHGSAEARSFVHFQPLRGDQRPGGRL